MDSTRPASKFWTGLHEKEEAMERKFYTDLAASGLRMPVGTDLVLHCTGDRDAILLSGERLGKVVVDAAQQYRTPLAFPLMDLTVEKEALLGSIGVSGADAPKYHFSTALRDDEYDKLMDGARQARTVRMSANCDALSYVAKTTDLVPVGMSIGPFSLMTKLVHDPITAIYMSGSGVSAKEDGEVQLVEQCLAMAEALIARSLALQIEAGAKAVFVCEPAASIAFISPKQIKAGGNVFERYVMEPNQRLAALLHAADVDLIFHDCGELTDQMVSEFALLDPAIMSLGSSRCLWDDAKIVPNSTVLYGNLPTKKFYSDAEMSLEAVCAKTRELLAKMQEAHHPYILGSECDILAVDNSMDAILSKTEAFLTVAR